VSTEDETRAHVAAIAKALRSERRARRVLDAASDRSGCAMRALVDLGLPGFQIAAKVARAMGETLTTKGKQRLAWKLRKRARASRAGERVLEFEAAGHGEPAASGASLPGKETHMPKLLKRTTVTEEYVEPEDLAHHEAEAANDDVEADDDEVDDEDEGEEGDEDEDEDTAPARRARRRRKS
jgi:hypothetical protein